MTEQSGARAYPVTVFVNAAAHWVHTAGNIAGGPLDLVIRLMVGMPFVISALLKLADWDTALLLAANEYPVDWMAPEAAAVVGVTVELLGGIGLILGLAARPAALALGVLVAVIHIEYAALSQNLLIGAFCLWFTCLGAGPLSLDRLVGPGLADMALPLVGRIFALFTAATARLRPALMLLLRLWLGGLGLLWAAGMFGAVIEVGATWHLPLLSVQGGFGLGLAVLAPAVAIILGLATRLSALAMALLVLSTNSMGLGQHAVETHLLLQLLLLCTNRCGWLSIDHGLMVALRARFPRYADLSESERAQLPHIVVVGAGFGGLTCVNALKHQHCRITLIDRHNYHLFQPLLYQVATATLSPAEIATPIRSMMRDARNTRVLLGEVTGVDTRTKEVIMDERRIGYDMLVLATGARHSYFGRDEWGPFAPGLKQIDDATSVRRRILLAFERAETSDDAQLRQSLLTFVVVGAGPTGVELAGAIAELARHGMRDDFTHIDPGTAQVILVQSGPRVLPAFPAVLSERTRRDLERLGVDVRTGQRVVDMDENGVQVGEQRIEAKTIFWAAGVAASPAAAWLDAPADRAGRLKCEPDLSVPGHTDVFVIGDTCWVPAWHGAPVPGLAPAAKQAGGYVAKLIAARLTGREPPASFKYRHLGSMATIGRKAAVADFGFIKLSGAAAWWLWGAAHIAFLANMRSRVTVAMDWFWAYLTFRASTRLITGIPGGGTSGGGTSSGGTQGSASAGAHRGRAGVVGGGD